MMTMSMTKSAPGPIGQWPAPITDAIPHTAIRRVLIIFPQLLGDAVLATTLLTALRAQVPGCEVDILVADSIAALIAADPYVSALFVVPRAWRRRGFWLTLRPRLTLLFQLRQRHYDLLIQSPHTTDGSWGPALIALLRIRYAVGASASSHGSPLKRLLWKRLFTHQLPRPHPDQGPRHVADLHLDLLRRVGLHPQLTERTARLVASREAEITIRTTLTRLRLSPGQFVVLAPTAGQTGRYLDAGMARQVIAGLQAQGQPIVVIAAANPRECAFVAGIRKGFPDVHDLSGQLTLPELIALLRCARGFIGTDSGPMHMAAAVGIPVVACFGPGDEVAFGPWQTRHRIVSLPWACRPCYADGCGNGGIADCLAALPADAVLQAAHELFFTPSAGC